jgi:cellulase/cellobiase CelA1
VEFDLAYQISSIWNAEIAQHTETRYVIKHPSWSDTIRPGESVQFGFIGTPGNVTALPTAYTVRGDEPVPLPPPPSPTPPPPPPGGSNARVTFTKTTDWGTGYNAEIVIHAPSSSGLNGWRLEFDLADAITTLWNGVVASPVPGHYVVRNADWNGTVAPGGAAAIGLFR